MRRKERRGEKRRGERKEEEKKGEEKEKLTECKSKKRAGNKRERKVYSSNSEHSHQENNRGRWMKREALSENGKERVQKNDKAG